MVAELKDGLEGVSWRIRSWPRRTRLLALACLLAAVAGLAAMPVVVSVGAIGLAIGIVLGRLYRDAGPWRVVRGPADQVRTREATEAVSWRDVIEAMADPAVVIDADRMVVVANRAAHDVFAAIRVAAPLALASRSPELVEALSAVLGDRQPRTVRIHERIPVERILEAMLTPLRTDARAGPSVLLVLHDISERERLAQMRADFVAHASHELRTPLAALRGFIETLQGAARDDSAARERFLGIMSTEAHRMTRILDDLLSLARVEMRAHIPPAGYVAINEMLAEVVESIEPLAASVETTIQVETTRDERIVRGDRDEIVQVFVNLLQNAIKYGRKGGAVTIKVSDSETGRRHWVEIAVADNGPGIAGEHLPRLTERFYRVDDKSSREQGGTGLGLAIVKHILNRHGGILRIDSLVGRGSTFTVALPRETDKILN